MRKYFTSIAKEALKYRDDLFLIAIFYHRVFPFKRFIMLDVDLKFKIDLAELYDQFSIFENENKKTFAAVGRDLSPHYVTGILQKLPNILIIRSKITLQSFEAFLLN